jgi:hypothetical protein
MVALCIYNCWFYLLNFRETLIGQLYEYIKSLRSDFQAKSTFSKGEGPPKGHNMPEIINYIMWGRQLEARVSK